MQKLVDGVHHFQRQIFSPQRQLFEQLAEGQRPLALFITCSDSRINPNLITQTDPGDLFILRNAGNLVPPYGAANGGEAPTIEFAVSGLGVKDVIVCGHTHCGAMKALMDPASVSNLPAVRTWLKHAEVTRRILADNYPDLDDDCRINVATQENVLAQIENLRTHPSIAVALGRQSLKLHAWVYKFETGQVFSYSPVEGQYLPLSEDEAMAFPHARTAMIASI